MFFLWSLISNFRLFFCFDGLVVYLFFSCNLSLQTSPVVIPISEGWRDCVFTMWLVFSGHRCVQLGEMSGVKQGFFAISFTQMEMLDVRFDVNLYPAFVLIKCFLHREHLLWLAEIGNAEAVFWQNSLNLTPSLFMA